MVFLIIMCSIILRGMNGVLVVIGIAIGYDRNSAREVADVMSVVVWDEIGCCVVVELADVK